jgi:hypothetical protein
MLVQGCRIEVSVLKRRRYGREEEEKVEIEPQRKGTYGRGQSESANG